MRKMRDDVLELIEAAAGVVEFVKVSDLYGPCWDAVLDREDPDSLWVKDSDGNYWYPEMWKLKLAVEKWSRLSQKVTLANGIMDE